MNTIANPCCQTIAVYSGTLKRSPCCVRSVIFAEGRVNKSQVYTSHILYMRVVWIWVKMNEWTN